MAEFTIQYDPPVTSEYPYVPSDELKAAVNLALNLGKPLLVTGESGVGKSELAKSLTHSLQDHPPLVRFVARTSSTASDLYYRYDALHRFADSQASDDLEIRRKVRNPSNYITFQGLGLAILLAMGPDAWIGPARDVSVRSLIPEEYQKVSSKGPTRSVVLIDELDKAPRDLANDILVEVQEMSCEVRETGWLFPTEGTPLVEEFRPILIITSNQEKELPDAFLRRCLFCHISFPDQDHLTRILQRHLGNRAISPEFYRSALALFLHYRNAIPGKKPATGELIDWTNALVSQNILLQTWGEEEKKVLRGLHGILGKNPEDLAALASALAKFSGVAGDKAR